MPELPPATFESFVVELDRLVANFERNYLHFQQGDYNEASVRQEYLDPFFRALGWDVSNSAGLIHTEREVDIEVRTAISGRQTRADYVFRINRIERFTCEAKKPAETLGDLRHIYQAKRDAFARGIPLAILSDFEGLKIYVVGARPLLNEPHVGELKNLQFTQYRELARELWELLARDNVAAGSIDRRIDELPKRRLTVKGKQGWLFKPDRTRSIDAEFLNLLDDARQQLGSDLLKHNDRADLLEGNALNEAAQRILDRLIFLRICEDRGIDTGTLLETLLRDWYRQQQDPPKLRRPLLQGQLPLTGAVEEEPPGFARRTAPPPEGGLYRELVEHIASLDHRPPSLKPFLNGQLFKPHFSEQLVVGDEWLANFLSDLTSYDSGYNFADIKVEILGDAYERFLGKVIRPLGRGTTIEEKPEVRKAGGVYYTPRYIVDYIVEQTVGRLLEGKSPKEVAKLRFLDPACGSGSFLVRVYERVMEHYLRWYQANPAKRRPEDCYVDLADNVRLTTALKRRILRENIHGVDLDRQAVEVTQLSLYLKMLEGENRDSLRAQTELFRTEALLPPLDRNILCGNSLIASDFSLDPAELVRVNAFDWDIGFADIMQAGGFDAVVGNPPYVRIQGFPEEQVAYFVGKYRAATGNCDLYVNFVQRGYELLNPAGLFGMILPNKFFRTDYGAGLRGLLSTRKAVSRIMDFGASQVFEATTYTCLLFLSHSNERFGYAMAEAEPAKLTSAVFRELAESELSAEAWSFADSRTTILLAKLRERAVRLLDLPAEMSRGSSSGDDEVFVLKAEEANLENALLRVPVFASDFGRYSFHLSPDWRIIFPYVSEASGYRLVTTSELKKSYPRTYEYLASHADKLKRRKQFKEWFGYSAARNLNLHDGAQIIVPLLANTGLFTLVPESSRGKLCPMAGGGFTITLGKECKLAPEFVLGLLNSKLLFWVLRTLSNVFRGGWITCTKQYFGELPIVSIATNDPGHRATHDRLVELVDKMLKLTPALRAAKSEAERTALQNAVTKTDREIDQLVYRLYGLTPEEIALVEGTAAPAPNPPADTFPRVVYGQSEADAAHFYGIQEEGPTEKE